ncbi:MAG: GntR family transcriptional regulator [Bacteroidota bacterium]
MEFRDNEAIYLQIAAYISNKILSGKWPADQKLPAVRELAIELQVNLNTVMRSYEYLQNLGVIYNKRGLGLYVAADGYEKVKAHRRENFIRQDLPVFFTNIYLLDITTEDIAAWYEQFKDKDNENK